MEYSEIIKQLEKKRITFENDTYQKPTSRDIQRWKTTLHDDAARLSGCRKSIQLRAHRLSKRIQKEFGDGVLLLVLSLKCRAEFVKIEPQPFISALRKWWKHVTYPNELKMVASECFRLPHSERVVDLERTRSTLTGQSAADVFGAPISIAKVSS